MPTVRYGERSSNVAAVQRALNGFNLTIGGLRPAPLAIDGVYGTKTADAVRTFRALAGLSYSGNVVDEQTWQLLGLGSLGAGAAINTGAATRPRTVTGGAGGSVNAGGGAAGNAAGSAAGSLLANTLNNPNAAADEAAKKKKAQEQQQLLIFGGIALVLVLVLTKR